MAELEFVDLSVKIGERVVLDRITLRVAPGEFVALIGPNGAGKTTLLKTALALRTPSSGGVRLANQPVAALPARTRAALIAWLPQHIRADEPVTGLESVAAARFRFRESHAQSRREAERALARVGASAYAERPVTQLSGGERQRVAFACLVAQEAQILVFDEPANHLDPAQQLDVYRLLGELWREGRSILCINHDVNLLHQVGDAARVRVVGLRAGSVAFDTPFADPELPAQLGKLFGIEMDSLRGTAQRFIVPRQREHAVKLRAVLLVAACLALLLAAVLVGPQLSGAQGEFIVWQLRVPRVLVGMLVGATLALVGAVFQALFQNPLATSDTVGTTAGATVGALFALALDSSRTVQGLPLVTVCAFAGALGTSLLVASFASSRQAHSSDVLLAGIAVTLATGALASGIQYVSDSRALFAATQWSLGQLPQVGYRGVLLLAPICALSCALLLLLTRPLQAFALGEDLAHSQGVNVPRLRLLALGLGSLGVAACVAWCGPIAFVGLIVPHLVRRLLGSSYRVLLPMSLCVGAALLVTCDTFARLIVPGRELPVGIVTAALGAPALVALVARGRR